MPETDRLLDEYAARFARGGSPDARDYLARAGAGAHELRELIDAFLIAAPPPAPGEEALALMTAWAAGKPPLAELRRRRGRLRDAVVDAIVEALRIDPARRARVAGHYQRLESGLLDLRRVDPRVLGAIAGAIGATVDDLARWGPRLRAEPVLMARMEMLAPPHPADEVDLLFGVAG
ncbi:MAG: hypothetical protein QOK40_1743 [Miltoncostaeaceae bacterium]|nr:hypothetical protein [Miltoncostaeaceae bacterium]